MFVLYSHEMIATQDEKIVIFFTLFQKKWADYFSIKLIK